MIDVSRETQDELDRYAALLRRWSAKINLVAPSTLDSLESRHIADSLQLADIARSDGTWCDLGSGGGLPGLVVAIARPDIHVTLIESDTRKAIFLQTVARELNLSATVLAERIEKAEPAGADIVSARALAPLDRLIPLAVRHGRPDTTYVFPKGERYGQEIDRARTSFRFDVDVRPSITDKGAVILLLENIHRV